MLHDDASSDPLEQAIETAQADGRLLPWLGQATADHASPRREEILGLVVRMHDLGRIDAIHGLLDPAHDWDRAPDWLARQRVVTDLLPRLAASVDRLTSAVEAVQGRMVQHILDDAFMAWCQADLGRADEVIASLVGARPHSDRFVLAALVAGLRVDPGRFLVISGSMARGQSPGGRHLGARALGTMPATDDDSVAEAFNALGSIVEDRGLDASRRAEALSACVDIAVRAPEASTATVEELLRLAPGDPALLDACAQAFGRHALRLGPSVFRCLCEVLPSLNASKTQAVSEVDLGILQLLSESGRLGQAIEIIEAMMLPEDGALRLEQLDNTRHQLSAGDDHRLGRVVVRWLLSGEAVLGRAAADLVEGVHGREPVLVVDPGEFELDDASASFLARKAVGWLFIKPAVAASLLMSLLQQVGGNAMAAITALLFDPLLINYPGSVRRLIDARASDLPGVARAALDRMLVSHDAHVSAIEAVGRIRELHQSERNRRIEVQREMDGLEEARRVAEAKSIMSLIAHRYMLLHGARSVSYVEDLGSGDWRRIDNPLGRVGVEMELPMQLTFDPMGLERTLSVFRRERAPG